LWQKFLLVGFPCKSVLVYVLLSYC